MYYESEIDLRFNLVNMIRWEGKWFVSTAHHKLVETLLITNAESIVDTSPTSVLIRHLTADELFFPLCWFVQKNGAEFLRELVIFSS